jgi:hypothetical protein
MRYRRVKMIVIGVIGTGIAFDRHVKDRSNR